MQKQFRRDATTWWCLIGAALLALPAGSAAAQPALVTLGSEQATMTLPASATDTSGMIDVTLGDVPPSSVSLQAAPLTFGDRYGFVHFPAAQDHDTVTLDSAALACQAGKTCAVPFTVTGLWPPGLYQGSVAARIQGQTVASAPLRVLRLASGFHPVVNSSLIHDGVIVVDVNGSTPTRFLLTVQNPTGSPGHHFTLATCLASAQRASASCGSSTTVSFLPPDFWLEPGAAQTVSVAVPHCPTDAPCSVNMVVGDTEDPADTTQMVISVNQHDPLSLRQFLLLVFTVFGSSVSVLLNNLFPTTRAKQAIRDDMKRAGDALRDCPNAGDALLDALGAEETRLKLVLRQISFYDSTKAASLESARQAAAALLANVALARRLSILRTDADGALLPIKIHAWLRGKLRDAEEALRAGDADSGRARLDEAQAQLTQARNDIEQAQLRQTLGADIDRLMLERGIRPKAAADAAQNAPTSSVKQRADRDPSIMVIVAQLDQDQRDYAKLSPTDLLDSERDFYVADVWTEYMERKLDEFRPPASDPARADPAREARREEWVEFSRAFLQCLRRAPNSDQTQTMLDLLRNDVSLQDVARAVSANQARIEADPQPTYLEAVDIGFVLTDPALRDVPAVRRLMSYEWSFDDGTSPPPNVDRCRHYFRPPPADLYSWFGVVAKRRYTISVKVSVPFTAAVEHAFSQDVTVRPSHSSGVSRLTGWTTFLLTAAIAVITAFGAKYAGGVPDTVGWPDLLTAFSLGFGLDQLRDAVTPPAAGSVAGGSGGATSPAAGAAAAQPGGPK
jgi:hypothetical protein